DQAKMAKSVGNIFVLHEALEQYGRDALIMYFCAGHYRQPIEFDEERLAQAAASVRRIREAGRTLVDGQSPQWSPAIKREFFDALAEDFNTPRALAAVFDWVSHAFRTPDTAGDADLREMLGVLGLENLLQSETVEIPAPVSELATARERARAARDYTEADRLREEIAALGWEVRDGPSGPELLPVS